MPTEVFRLVLSSILIYGILLEVVPIEACFSSLLLRTPRANVGLVVNGPKIYFAGGIDQHQTRSDIVEIFDSSTSTWSTMKIPVARDKIEAAAVGSYVLFAGGMTSAGQYNKVDILNIDTGSISTLDLPFSFTITNSLIVGSQALFYGRDNATIFVVDPAEHSFSTIQSVGGVWNAASNGTHLFTANHLVDGTRTSVFVYDSAGLPQRVHEWGFISRSVAFFVTPQAFIFVHPNAVSLQPLNPASGSGPTYRSTHSQVLAPITIGEVVYLVEPSRMNSVDTRFGRISRYAASDFQIHTSFKAVELNGVIYYATEDVLEPVISFNTGFLFQSIDPGFRQRQIPSLAIGDYLIARRQQAVDYYNVRTGERGVASTLSESMPLVTVRNFVIFANRFQLDILNVQTGERNQIIPPNAFIPTSGSASDSSGLAMFANEQQVMVFNISNHLWLPLFSFEGPVRQSFLAGETIVGIYRSAIETINVRTNDRQTYQFTERTEYTLKFSDSLVVIAGGRFTDNPTVTDDVLIVNIDQGSSINIQLSVGRRNVAVSIIDNRIVFAGGQLQSGRFSDRFEVFDAAELHWAYPQLDLPPHSILSPIQIAYVQGSLYLIRNNRMDIFDEHPIAAHRVGLFQFGNVRDIQVFGSKLILTSTTGPDVHQLSLYETSTNAWYSYEVNRVGTDATDPLRFVGIVADQLYANTFANEHQVMPIAAMKNRLENMLIKVDTPMNITIEAVGPVLSTQWTHNGRLLNETSLSLHTNATIDDEGRYVARIMDHCSTPMQQRIDVTIIRPPVFLSGLRDIFRLCHETDSALSVSIGGFNVSTSWTIDGQPYDHTNSVSGLVTISTMDIDSTLPCGLSQLVCITASNPLGNASMCVRLTSWYISEVFHGPLMLTNQEDVMFLGDAASLEVIVLRSECSNNHTWYENTEPRFQKYDYHSAIQVFIDLATFERNYTVQVQCGSTVFTSPPFTFPSSRVLLIGQALFIFLICLGGAFVAALIITAVFVAKRMRQGLHHEVELQQLLSQAKNESLTHKSGVSSSWLPTDDYTYQQLHNLSFNIDASELLSWSKNDPVKVDDWIECTLLFSSKSKKRDSTTPSMKESLIKGLPISLYTPSSPKYEINFEPSSFNLTDGDAVHVKFSITMLMTAKCNISVIIVCDKKKVYSVLEFKIASQMSMWIDLDEIKMSGDYLGGGGFGAVYRGNYRGQEVAVKQLLNQHLDDYLKKEFEREIMLMKDLRHPNIVQFVGASKVKDNLAIVIEFAPLGSLSRVLEDQKLSIALKLTILSEIAKALQFLHANGVIHRDIKPQNVLVFSLEERAPVHIKLTDFGTSRFISDDPQTITRNVGTTCYMAPEALGLTPKIDKSADVYSFAILAWEVMYEQQPFRDFKWQSDVEAHVKVGNRLPFPENANSEFVKLVEDCWHQDPAQRPTMAVVAQRLALF